MSERIKRGRREEGTSLYTTSGPPNRVRENSFFGGLGAAGCLAVETFDLWNHGPQNGSALQMTTNENRRTAMLGILRLMVDRGYTGTINLMIRKLNPITRRPAAREGVRQDFSEVERRPIDGGCSRRGRVS